MVLDEKFSMKYNAMKVFIFIISFYFFLSFISTQGLLLSHFSRAFCVYCHISPSVASSVRRWSYLEKCPNTSSPSDMFFSLVRKVGRREKQEADIFSERLRERWRPSQYVCHFYCKYKCDTVKKKRMHNKTVRLSEICLSWPLVPHPDTQRTKMSVSAKLMRYFL